MKDSVTAACLEFISALINSVTRNLGGFDCANNEKKMETNEQEWYLSSIKWRVRLVSNGTVNLVSLLL